MVEGIAQGWASGAPNPCKENRLILSLCKVGSAASARRQSPLVLGEDGLHDRVTVAAW